ncbi:EXOSC2 [Branchiostoma lanceolatum]|uniref:EXOSC2 protein n=1 Tax=Branchiostoma lanceolatum TaxID=7740 RepID=A0A8S4MNW2_BRALA|nr:EXOSC2 [Branchiostoma lanceolatum]
MFIQRNLCPSNCVGVMLLADMYGLSSLKTTARRQAMTHFSEVRQSEGFLSLSLKQLLDLLEDKELQVASEDEIALSVMRWLDHELESRKTEYMPKWLAKWLAKITAAKQGHLDGSPQLMADTGREEAERQPRDPPGGNKPSKQTFRYDFSTDTWTRLPDMPHGRAGHQSVIVDGKLFLVGGITEATSFNIFSMDCYDIEEGAWIKSPTVPAMNTPPKLTEQDWFVRGVKEAIYIRAHHPSLNRDGGRFRLPAAFDSQLTSSRLGLPGVQRKGRKKSAVPDAPKHLVTPGDVITTDTGYMRGHGTYMDDDKLKASLAGVVERVNKLICVQPLKTRYNGEIGDVVVGRVTEVGQRRWRVDVNSKLDAVLMLSAVNLPGGELERSAEDELMMREYLQEGDLISLSQGVMVQVSPSLVKRRKTHFHNLPCGASVILGNNGYVWVSPTINDEKTESNGGYEQDLEPVPSTDREVIARLRNCILALATHKLMLYDTSVLYAYEASRQLSLFA